MKEQYIERYHPPSLVVDDRESYFQMVGRDELLGMLLDLVVVIEKYLENNDSK